MAITFTEAKVALDEISGRVDSDRKRLEAARSFLSAAAVSLAAMPADYAGVGVDIDAELTNNPTDPAWINAQAEKDQLVANFQSLRTRADALLAAFDAV